jgi:Trypsin-like serine proteases, typically periplasmic, contain C-terminal PDZ domain
MNNLEEKVLKNLEELTTDENISSNEETVNTPPTNDSNVVQSEIAIPTIQFKNSHTSNEDAPIDLTVADINAQASENLADPGVTVINFAEEMVDSDQKDNLNEIADLSVPIFEQSEIPKLESAITIENIIPQPQITNVAPTEETSTQNTTIDESRQTMASAPTEFVYQQTPRNSEAIQPQPIITNEINTNGEYSATVDINNNLNNNLNIPNQQVQSPVNSYADLYNRQQMPKRKKRSKSDSKLLKTFFTAMAGAMTSCLIFGGGVYLTMPQLFSNAVATSSTSSNANIVQSDLASATSVIAANVIPGTVTVLVGDRSLNLIGNGSGIVYKNLNGKIYILTNAHVVENIDVIEVYRNDYGAERTDKATVVGVDVQNDVAVLEVADPENSYDVSISFANSDNLLVGQHVIAVGSPYVATLGESFSGSVTEGIISGLNRKVNNGSTGSLYRREPVYSTYIQISAAINGGNSGGALIDMNGNLIGINSAKISNGENMGLAIPTNTVYEVLETLAVPLPDIVDNDQ